MPHETYHATAVRLPVEIYERLRKISYETRVSLNALMVGLIQAGLDTMPESSLAHQTNGQRDKTHA